MAVCMPACIDIVHASIADTQCSSQGLLHSCMHAQIPTTLASTPSLTCGASPQRRPGVFSTRAASIPRELCKRGSQCSEHALAQRAAQPSKRKGGIEQSCPRQPPLHSQTPCDRHTHTHQISTVQIQQRLHRGLHTWLHSPRPEHPSRQPISQLLPENPRRQMQTPEEQTPRPEQFARHVGRWHANPENPSAQ